MINYEYNKSERCSPKQGGIGLTQITNENFFGLLARWHMWPYSNYLCRFIWTLGQVVHVDLENFVWPHLQ